MKGLPVLDLFGSYMENPPTLNDGEIQLLAIACDPGARGVPHVPPDASLDLHQQVVHGKVIPEAPAGDGGQFSDELDSGHPQLAGKFIL